LKEITKYIVIFFILAFPFTQPCLAYDIIDSLKKKLHDAPPLEKVRILNEISNAYWPESLDLSQEFSLEALTLARAFNDKKGIAAALNRLGTILYLRANYAEAIDHFLGSLEYCIETEDQECVIVCYYNLYMACNNSGKKEQACDFLKELIGLSTDDSDIAYYSNIMGYIKSELHDFENAKANIQRAIDIYQKMGNSGGTGEGYYNMGNMYQLMSLYVNAQECYFESMHNYREAGDIDGVAWAKIKIGLIYKHLKNYDLALEYSYKSLELYRQLEDDWGGTAPILNNIGTIWYEKESYEKALDYYNSALELYEIVNDEQGISVVSHNTGNINTRLGNYRKAFELFMKSVRIDESLGDMYGLARNHTNIGELYLLEKDYIKARESLDTALSMAQLLNAREVIKDNCHTQSSLYIETGDYEKALHFYELFDAYKDSIYYYEADRSIAELQVRYNRQRQISQMELLQKDNDIQQLNLIRMKNFLGYLGALSLAAGLFTVMVLYMYRYKKKMGRFLYEKNLQLEVAHRKLMKTEKNLRRMNATKDKFFSIIAHDLRNPFNALLMFSETLNHNYQDHTREQVLTYINIIGKSAMNLFTLLENLLEWSKSQTGKMEHNPEKFLLRELTENGKNSVLVNARQKNINILIEIDPRLEACADKNQILTVIRNLISNAVKFTHCNGTVRISANELKDLIEISVADNGVGIGKEELSNLFSLGYNITTAGTNNETGSGLGLMLCKEFVEKNGGVLQIKSEVGKGSTFTFTIPR
jgi:signal transduction histidine kinase